VSSQDATAVAHERRPFILEAMMAQVDAS